MSTLQSFIHMMHAVQRGHLVLMISGNVTPEIIQFIEVQNTWQFYRNVEAVMYNNMCK